MSVELKRTIPLIITFILGIILVTNFYVVSPPIQDFSGVLSNMAVIITGFAFIVGGGALTVTHGTNVYKRGKNWVFSVFLLIMLWAMVVIGLSLGTGSSAYTWIWDTIYTRIYQTTYGMFMFWYTSAVYRTFRFRSGEAAILLIAGILMLLGNATIGGAIWPGFPEISTWIMKVPTAAATRGIVISAAVGYTATAIRVMIGYERGYMSRD